MWIFLTKNKSAEKVATLEFDKGRSKVINVSGPLRGWTVSASEEYPLGLVNPENIEGFSVDYSPSQAAEMPGQIPKTGFSGEGTLAAYEGRPREKKKRSAQSFAEACAEAALTGEMSFVLPTPTACEWKGRGPNSRQKGLTSILGVSGCTLSPVGVEWMMGLPSGWSALDPAFSRSRWTKK